MKQFEELDDSNEDDDFPMIDPDSIILTDTDVSMDLI